MVKKKMGKIIRALTVYCYGYILPNGIPISTWFHQYISTA